MEWKFHIYTWGTASILTIVPYLLDLYGNTGMFCWIKDKDKKSSLWRFFQFFLPLYLAFVFNCVVYLRVTKRIKNVLHMQRLSIQSNSSDPLKSSWTKATEDAVEQTLSFARKLLKYPMILVITWFFATVNRIGEINFFLLLSLYLLSVFFYCFLLFTSFFLKNNWLIVKRLFSLNWVSQY